MTEANSAHIQDLAQLLARGEGTVLVGAGSSVACGYPGWEQFLERLQGEIRRSLPAGILDLSLTVRADALQDAFAMSDGGEEHYARTFSSMFHPDSRQREPPSWVHRLFDLEQRLYVTTNYTTELESIGTERGFGPALRWYEDGVTNLLRRIGARRVLYLHGRYDDDPVFRKERMRVVLGERSYKHAYLKEGKVRHILGTLANSGPLLIVGASLADEDVRNTLREVAAFADESAPPHYIIYERWPKGTPRHLDSASIEQDLVGLYNLQPIFYDVRVDSDGRADFAELTQVIDELAGAVRREGGKRAAPGGRGRDSSSAVALASSLTRLLPSPRVFTDVARALGVEVPPSVRQRSPMDRWFGLVATACRVGAVDVLRRAARSQLPPRLAPELDSGTRRGLLALTARDRISQLLDRLAEPDFGSLRKASAAGSQRDDLGLLALDRYWNRLRPPVATSGEDSTSAPEPSNELVKRWCDSLDERRDAAIYRRALEQGQLTRTRTPEFADADLGIAMAADFLARRFSEEPDHGHDLIAWSLPRLAEFTAFRHEILVHLMAWWPGARHALTSFLAAGLARPADRGVSQLLELTFAERLQREAGLPPLDPRAPVSVQWAEREGFEVFLASILEILGEDQLETYVEHWRSAREPARTALARAIRRSLLQDEALPPGTLPPVLKRAIEATLPAVTSERVLNLVASPSVLKVWLDVLPLDPEPPQIEALGGLLARGAGLRGERTARRAAERLSEHPDLVLVWDTLGDRRKGWIKWLEPHRLAPLATNELQRALSDRTMAEGEREDLQFLRTRLAERTKPTAIDGKKAHQE